jgi:quercetin 2,3-dioxygenase
MKNTPSSHLIMEKFPLGFQWSTLEPFLFCVHHHDLYPEGNGQFGPDPSYLQNRPLGSDFQTKDGFRMYHGERVPGFPVHPHRGFETITIVRQGYADHADSLGAAGRYGQGDVQWMTAGNGIQHSEMFPLIHTDQKNTLELFQIWLNLPKKSKMVSPHFTMFWSEKIPKINLHDGAVEISLIAGELNGQKSLSPPPDSWASQPESEIGIYLVKMKAHSKWILPASQALVSRMLYFFSGTDLNINSESISKSTGLNLNSLIEATLQSGETDIEFLILQAKPIGEPVVQHGPFVMNTKEEIMQTFADYQKTQFGGWPWDRVDMIHGGAEPNKSIKRFAKFPDGKIETPS